MALFARVFLAAAVGMVAASAVSPAFSHDSFVREQRAVKVMGKSEIWELFWGAEPSSSFCGPDDVSRTQTCACEGLAYAETGQLFLVRKSKGQEIDRIDLGAPFSAEVGVGVFSLQRWPAEEGDAERDRSGDSALADEIRARHPVHVLELADYDHDGDASEFLIRVGYQTCGHANYAAVGISKSQPKLHFFTSANWLIEPLVMGQREWEALAKSGRSTKVTTSPCGDHGSNTQFDTVVSAAGGRIQAKVQEYSCTEEGTSGKLIRETLK